MTEEPIHAGTSDPHKTVDVRPRVWTVFTAFGTALLLSIFFQAILGGIIAAIELSGGVKPNELTEAVTDRMTSPYVFVALIAAGQLGFALGSFLPAYWSPLAFRERVGWKTPQPSWRVYPISMLSSIVPLAVGLAAAEALTKVIPADQSLAKLFDALTIDSAIVFVLFIGIAPGLFEEVMFRGYMQRRLVQRWGAIAGISITSIIFALVHVSPHAIAAVLLLGFWFGYLAWRSKSILPTIMCHFFVNSGLNLWRVIIKFGEIPETTQTVVHIILLLIGLICFAVCLSPSFWREQVPAGETTTSSP